MKLRLADEPRELESNTVELRVLDPPSGDESALKTIEELGLFDSVSETGTTSPRAGPAGLAAPQDRGGDRDSPRDGERLPQGCRRRRARAGPLGTVVAKTGQ